MQLSLLKEKQINKIMPSQNDGVMIILSSPSGAGKTTLVKELSKLDNYEISISHTTRKPRSYEIIDEHYFFIDNKLNLIREISGSIARMKQINMNAIIL